MAAVERLVTVVDEDPGVRDGDGFSAHLFAVLADGSRVLVLGDRGWAQTSVSAARPPDVVVPDSTHDRAQVEDTARTVVGPDEPGDDGDYEAAAVSYWRYLADILARKGVDVPADELRGLPHDVELSETLTARVR